MTVAEAAKKWGVSESTIRRNVGGGGAIQPSKFEAGQWFIADDAQFYYLPGKKKNRRQIDDYFDILSATNQKRALGAEQLNLTAAQWEDYVQLLEKGGLVMQGKSGLLITPQGETYISRGKEEFKKLFAPYMQTLLAALKLAP